MMADRLTAERLAEIRETARWDLGPTDRRVLLTEVDRLTAERKRLAHLLGYLLRQYERVVDVHALVRMDTEEDRALHDRAVREFRQGAEPIRETLRLAATAEASHG
jgi:hypothetical protein